MPIRITQSMLYSRALGDIQSGLFRFSQLQQEVATGRRVNRPSDDPAAALRILPLRNDIADLEQLSENVSIARETLDTSTAALEDASSVMTRVRELATQAANGTLSQRDRNSIGAELDQLLNQMLGLANSRRGDRFLFGGTETGSAPFDLNETGERTLAVYTGNRENLEVDVAPGVTTGLNVPGDAIFLQRDREATTFYGISDVGGTGGTGAQPVGVGDTGTGFGSLQVTFGGLTPDAPATVSAGGGATNALGEITYSFASAPDTLSIGGGPSIPIPAVDETFTTSDGRTISLTVTGVPATTNGTFTSSANLSTDNGQTTTNVADFSDDNVAIYSEDDGSVLYVDPRELSRTGTEDVRFNGTFDVFTTLSTLRDVLRNTDDASPEESRGRVADLLDEIDTSQDAILDGLRELGFRSSSMDVLKNRVEGLRISRTDSLSLVQDTDIAESILELQRQDIAYQAALQVSARVVQTTLQGFLR
ncbi:MAG: flagellar hook-associated protein FlgL [Planctomycetota bacterium]